VTRTAALLVMLLACERAGEPPNPKPPPVELRTACDVIAIQVEPDGIWLGAPPGIQCRGVGTSWLAQQLHTMKSALAGECEPRIELAAAPPATARHLASAMDAAIAVGLSDIALVDPGGLAVAFAKLDRRTVAASCASPARVPPARAGARPVPQDAHDVIITKTAITMRGTTVIELAKLTPGSSIPELAHALGTPGTLINAVILRADADTSALVINRVIATARGAGYDEVIFATTRDP
jgi:biopolymer transport protein ExbD